MLWSSWKNTISIDVIVALTRKTNDLIDSDLANALIFQIRAFTMKFLKMGMSYILLYRLDFDLYIALISMKQIDMPSF